MPEPSTPRDLRLDFFRGVSLILIFVDHIPENFLSYFTLQSWTFFDAAEVFIFISGYTAALVYERRLAEKGAIHAAAQVWRRAWQLYVAHIFLFVLFVAEVSYTAATFKNPMYNEEMRVADFLGEPHVAVVKALLLQFQPAFLDILPMYIVMLLIFPAVLIGMRAHWLLVLVPATALYLVVQVLDLGVPAYPPGHEWYFNPLAWQLLFVAGAVLAHLVARTDGVPRLAHAAFPIAAAVFLAALVVRATWTLHGFWEQVPALLIKELWPADKSNLAPARLIPFLAFVVVVARLVPRDAAFLGSRAARPLLLCGRHSLEIFCLGILLSALGHVVISEFGSALWLQLAVNATGVAIMLLTARAMDWYREVDRAPVLRPVAAGPARGAAP